MTQMCLSWVEVAQLVEGQTGDCRVTTSSLTAGRLTGLCP